MRHLLEHILKGIVRYPDELKISEQDEGDKVIYEIQAHPSDVGQIIGKDGRTIKSINLILTAARGSKKKKFILKVLR